MQQHTSACVSLIVVHFLRWSCPRACVHIITGSSGPPGKLCTTAVDLQFCQYAGHSDVVHGCEKVCWSMQSDERLSSKLMYQRVPCIVHCAANCMCCVLLHMNCMHVLLSDPLSGDLSKHVVGKPIAAVINAFIKPDPSCLDCVPTLL